MCTRTTAQVTLFTTSAQLTTYETLHAVTTSTGSSKSSKLSRSTGTDDFASALVYDAGLAGAAGSRFCRHVCQQISRILHCMPP